MKWPAVLYCAAAFFLSAILVPARSDAQPAKKYWVYFRDKGPSSPARGVLPKGSAVYERALGEIDSAALARRAAVLAPDALVDAADLPLYEPYLRQTEFLSGRLVHSSRWLNAASFFLGDDLVARIRALAFVEGVEPVVTIVGKWRREEFPNLPEKSATLNYGPSLAQDQAIGVTRLHDLGITGRGILIGMLDTGFRWRAHEALQSRRIVAEHDFIFNRDTTANFPNDNPDQDFHGTLTLSVVGGYMPGQLIGPAYDARFLLAKTELIYPSLGGDIDTKVEEDNWVSGIEWMEARGVQVVSSSLGYNDFEDTTGYTWAHGDFNGKTSVSARAATRAARLGVVVCDAMGNEGNGDGVAGTMLTPADADSIISVGAVTISGRLASFSSTGPTNDNRIKPDLVAPGVGIYYAATPGPSTYAYAQGTSLATPLVAGSAALLLSARPELNPLQVRDLLRSTAKPIYDVILYPQSPNNFAGWGMVNAFDAVTSLGPVFSNVPEAGADNFESVVTTMVASRYGLRPDSVILWYRTGTAGSFASTAMHLDSSVAFPSSGRYRAVLPRMGVGTAVTFYVEARDSASNAYRSPPAATGTFWTLNYGIPGLGNSGEIPASFSLRQNYPNPFNALTIISYDLVRREHVLIDVFDLLGRRTETLVDEMQDAGSHAVAWNAQEFASGVYFYRLTTSSAVSTRKMILLR